MSGCPFIPRGLTAESQAMPRPPYDPKLEAAVAWNMGSPEAFETLEGIRADPFSPTLDAILEKFPDLKHTEYTIPGPADNPNSTVTLSVFVSQTSTSTNRPVVYNIHGGGQISGTRFTGLDAVAGWYTGLDIVIITVEYRLAPEHPAPAALNDCYAGLAWVGNHAAQLGIHPGKILVQGVSGGGPLAAACAIKARNEKFPPLRAQLLSTPMLDSRCGSVSSRQFEGMGIWNGRTNRLAWGYVLGKGKVEERKGGEEEEEKVSELISPSRASDLAGVAPAFIDVGDAEVFRDEAVAYASLLWKSGVSTELHVWPACWHAFDMIAPKAPVSQAATATRRNWVCRQLFD
ncbi:Alpha/Beta hydrolase protein [Aspergillus insuetus]